MPHLRTLVVSMMLGLASWYSYDGITASGDHFNGSGYTAASTSLPFGSIVKVERVDNGKYVIVRINDRGHHKKGRIIDLTKESFGKIGNLKEGLIKVKVSVIGRDGNKDFLITER